MASLPIRDLRGAGKRLTTELERFKMAVAPATDPTEDPSLGVEKEVLAMTTTLYETSLTSAWDVGDWTLEGPMAASFPTGRLRLESAADPAAGQSANFVAWLPVQVAGDVRISWSFRPLREPGLAMVFWGARSRDGGSIHDSSLPGRSGEYEQYHSGAIDAYHLSYYRRMWPSERSLHTCNLRKSHGFHLVAHGADPLPPVLDADRDYRLCLTWEGATVRFTVDDIPCLTWTDDGSVGGCPRVGGAIGLRQMAPLIAEYSDLRVEALDGDAARDAGIGTRAAGIEQASTEAGTR